MAQNRLGVAGKTGGGGTSVRSVTKLNDAVTTVVGGLGVHAVALHQGQAGKVVWRELVVTRHTQYFLVNLLLFFSRYIALLHSTVQGFVQNCVLAWQGGEVSACLQTLALQSLLGRQIGRSLLGLGQHAQVQALSWVNTVGVADAVGLGHILGQTQGIAISYRTTQLRHVVFDNVAQGVATLHRHAFDLRVQDGRGIDT